MKPLFETVRSPPTPALLSTHNPNQNNNSNSNGNTNNTNNANTNNIESTYISLIEQYLTLFHYDNAIFIAERLVSFHSTPYSNYLLAMCYYRANKIQYARRILTTWNQKNNTIISTKYNSNKHDNNHNNNNDLLNGQIAYLLAKCNVDMESWRDAEDILLKDARMKYIYYKKHYKEEEKNHRATTSNSGGGGEDNGKLPPMANSLEEYLKTLVSNMSHDKHHKNQLDNHHHHHLPIPNGAAGLYLLGYICQRTMRKDKAAIYYQLSLKVSK